MSERTDPRTGDAELVEADGYDVSGDLTAMRRAEMAAGAFLAGYSSANTRRNYQQALRFWFSYLGEQFPTVDPISDVKRGHVDTWMRYLEAEGNHRAFGSSPVGLSAGTVSRYVSTVSAFYKWLLAEEYIDRDPTLNIRRPKTSRESSTPWLSRLELTDFLNAAEREGGYPYALVCLLGVNGLRIAEACGCDVTDLGRDRYHHTLKIVGKGNQPAIIGLAPRVMDALSSAIGDRKEGPLLLTRTGSRMQREAAGRIVRRIALAAGIRKHISPHSLRHSCITAYLNATDGDITGARDLARHADLGTTQRYDRRRRGLDGSPSYVVANVTSGRD